MPRKNCVTRVFGITLLGLLLATRLQAQPDSPPEVRASLDFEEGFETEAGAWQTVNNAEFSVDSTQPHGGSRCAHIRVSAGAALNYQHIERRLAPVAWGDEFRATLWVRTEGVQDGIGAYAALEFLDAQGQRVSLAQSRVSRATGAHGWEQLRIEAQATKRTKRASLHLLLHAHGDAWFDDVSLVQTGRREALPDLGGAERQVTIDAEHPVLEKFGGVGFHVFDHTFAASEDYMDTVMAKRWRELNPSFARMNHQNNWDRAQLDRMAQYLLRFKQETQTEVYVTTWDPKDTASEAERMAYARQVTDTLAYLVREKGATNITTYCMTNELSLGEWGSLYMALPRFKEYHAALFQAFKERGLDIRLLATDASPFSFWDSIDWAAQNMDEITGVYGGHHYIAEYELDDPCFYPWFLKKVQGGVSTARSKGKDFILGEFGARQDGRTVDGIKRDVCAYWDTPQEPLVAIQLSEAVIAAINAGVYSMGYWTFADLPDEYNPHYINKWGLFKRSGNDNATRPHYYAYGLLTKFFRGPATTLAVNTNDPRVRAAAVRHHGCGSLSIALVNRCEQEVPVRIALGGETPARPFRKYVYDPLHVPTHPFGDLQPFSETIAAANGAISTRLGTTTLTVLTTAYDGEAPAPVAGLTRTVPGQGTELTWQASPEADFCYYRVYRMPEPDSAPGPENQIASTIAPHFNDPAPAAGIVHYAVIAVDQSGNAGPPARN